MMKNLYIKEVIKGCKHFIHFTKGLFEAQGLSSPNFPKQLLCWVASCWGVDLRHISVERFCLFKVTKWYPGIMCNRLCDFNLFNENFRGEERFH